MLLPHHLNTMRTIRAIAGAHSPGGTGLPLAPCRGDDAPRSAVRRDASERDHGPRQIRLMDDTDYALGRTDEEYERLVEQAEVLRPLTERMLRAAGIGAGMRVLDVGCGLGDVSFLVSELVGPGGSVVGIDLDGAAL